MDIENLHLNFDFLDDLEIKVDSPPADVTGSEKTGSEKYNNVVKQFLEKLVLRDVLFKGNKTFLLLKNALQDLRLPEPGEQIRIRTQQQINLLTIILKILDEHLEIEELSIATYTFNREALAVLLDLHTRQKIKKINLLLASSYSFRDKKYYAEIKEICLNEKKHSQDDSIHLCFAWSHFKISLAKCGDNYYQWEGSMNYSMNNMAEQLIFENSQSTYNHDYVFINNIMTDQNNKALEIIC